MSGTRVFEGIVGNRAALRALERALCSGELSHAYLFHGPEGVGKRTVARRFGAALVAGGEAAFGRALRGLHPDLTEVEPEGAFTTIGQVREVRRLAASRPFEGERRVFVLRADTLNVQAANALLKTLEEPEAGVVFLLLAASREAVLPTIASRARPLRFDPVPREELTRFLAERGVSEPALAAALGRGSVGLALRYAEERELRELRGAVLEAVLGTLRDFEDVHRAAGRIAELAGKVGEKREREALSAAEEPDRAARERARRAGRAARDGAVREAFGLLSTVCRDAAVIAAGAPELIVNADRGEELRRVVRERAGVDWAAAAARTREAALDLAYNVSPEAILEVTLSELRRKTSGSSPGW
ncbi:hypothetical protein Rxycam_00909 [Rubrobacter xylanophilus DSM 9941]|uniref:DNA polymerase III subunit n=1 Tax=Rubrobacter xylanophilus TaxID=49319 RepID=UPI001C63BC8C|nr:hypothetical protein [Rubrobacter xylanophilus]QYJ15097.1 hypothetical protein Rxycam_00909 [Rubrobacter xylanophilus DSM 9941]